ncbi:hypothetical protein DFA_00706 [Cavenderia fasciculata]|uniref:Uncharacterized protein n=1 Tax=Cavenderia fasciculata TaxID=261658 RepID=F4PTA5_CACFS|nr:uncharacterized protein DFA_00706 [Cavenderia fasciculata]EGG20841.1 hypothetical protein DFA_00706 [Cavenderia fasciculata]|eukprot:XP_004358691.1 hypothetical protein DFA_00706 [Cavenderia fasciculata]
MSESTSSTAVPQKPERTKVPKQRTFNLVQISTQKINEPDTKKIDIEKVGKCLDGKELGNIKDFPFLYQDHALITIYDNKATEPKSMHSHEVTHLKEDDVRVKFTPKYSVSSSQSNIPQDMNGTIQMTTGELFKYVEQVNLVEFLHFAERIINARLGIMGANKTVKGINLGSCNLNALKQHFKNQLAVQTLVYHVWAEKGVYHINENRLNQEITNFRFLLKDAEGYVGEMPRLINCDWDKYDWIDPPSRDSMITRTSRINEITFSHQSFTNQVTVGFEYANYLCQVTSGSGESMISKLLCMTS